VSGVRLHLRRWVSLWAVALGWAGVVLPQAQASPSSLPASTIALWDRVARCETGSTWTGLGSTYQGGLGFYYATWDWWAKELGLWSKYPDAGMAPRLVQIRVADYGRRVHGGYWGCL
jgi:hypothetical protein